MEVKEVIKKLEKTPEFKNWKGEDRESYLSNAFIILGENKWSVGYYSKKRNRITTFEINGSIKLKPYEKILSSGDEIRELKLEDITIAFSRAIGIGESFKKEKYSSEGVLKTIVVLQSFPTGQMWNITYLTSGFSTLNIKIDASSGKILKHTLTPLFKFDNSGKK